MSISIHKLNKISGKENLLVFANNVEQLKDLALSKPEFDFVKTQIKDDKKKVFVNQYHRQIVILINETKDELFISLEKLRKSGNAFQKFFNDEKAKSISIIDFANDPLKTIALLEGIELGNYQFLKYKSEKKTNTLTEIKLYSNSVKTDDILKLNIIIEATLKARDLINEPLSYLTAEVLSEQIQKMGKEAGFNVEVFNKIKIESLKMGGLLAVNKGSIDPPTFNILEWNPEKAKNKKPIILVGKGIVFDTGGMNLKPGSSMDGMKCDMSGAAAVASAIYAVAKAKLPYHVIGLIPATDNRPDGNAYVPGDILKMHDGTTVEVFSTDAEGRLILADALSYAKKYKPEVVIDIATLTGAASRAIGKYGIVAMGNNEPLMRKLKNSGEAVNERIAEFPFWDEYAELIKSEIADLKNIGGVEAGAITAGKFLEHFTSYPWVHLDIAGPAFVESKYNYRGIGGTGVGVRLFFDFIANYSNKDK
ncbi:MAG: leucyl aminopeptidase [Bacteroidota bacterium]